MKKSDKERLKKIVTTWDELQKQMTLRGITADKLLEDEFSQWAVTTPLYNIGEQVYQLSAEFKQAHPEQPWNMVAPACGIGWFMTMRASTGPSSWRSCLRIWDRSYSPCARF